MSQRYTTIEELNRLPDISELESAVETRNEFRPTDMRTPMHVATNNGPNLQKFLRQTDHRMPPESGMERRHMLPMPPPESIYPPSYFGKGELIDDVTKEPQYIERFVKTTDCVSVNDHVSSCHVCSKLYKNDRTFFIILILVLIVICLLMLKKILDTN